MLGAVQLALPVENNSLKNSLEKSSRKTKNGLQAVWFLKLPKKYIFPMDFPASFKNSWTVEAQSRYNSSLATAAENKLIYDHLHNFQQNTSTFCKS